MRVYDGETDRVEDMTPALRTLALVNRGRATTAELMALAREIADGVEALFGVVLHPEPVLVGHKW